MHERKANKIEHFVLWLPLILMTVISIEYLLSPLFQVDVERDIPQHVACPAAVLILCISLTVLVRYAVRVLRPWHK